ncbi:MAG: flagellin, partial [Selenomonadaceae bacterium]|nr:flagellin [Selenomonadaceae bacterium]
MAMTVMHNSSAQLALGVLNKNSNALGKALRKVSTGQKLNSAQDDASAYSISEQMRSKIRALEQDVRNVQNGSAMLKTAEGGIQNIVDELRELKELALDAANDSNTDDDRRIMQKVFDQKKDNINDIATATNYNGKRLLDGSYFRPNSVPSTLKPSGYTSGGAYVNGVIDMFSLTTGVMSKSGAQEWANERTAYLHSLSSGDVVLNFGSVKLDGEVITFPYELDQQGFTILCTLPTCESYFGFKFDAGMDKGTGEASGDDTAPFYTIGIRGAKSSAEVAKAFFDGVANALGMNEDEVGDIITLTSAHTLTIKRVGEQYTFNQNYASYWIYSGYDANYAPADDYELVVDGGHAKDWNAITIQHGAYSNQGTNFYVNDMHTDSLGIDVASVTNLANAKAALDVIDSAIEYALNEATNVGASLARLDYTEGNVSTEVENVQAAESTIRDADMAKEMTDYTRWNVLMQSAQSMLA